MNFTICIYVCSQASLWIQTKINKYAKFVNYIASLHTAKKKSIRIHIFTKIHKQKWWIPCLYPKYRSWSSKNINKHLIVLMKLPNPSVKIRYRSFPCLTNISSWLKGTFWLRSRQQSSTIGSMNIKIHREVDVFDYMPITY